MYKYRLYPSKKQQKRLLNTFDVCKNIYNELLELSISVYKENGVMLTRYNYHSLLVGVHPEIPALVKRGMSDRLSKSFQNFFRKCKDPKYKKKGFPRFKSKIHSITYPQGGFKFLSQKKLYTSKIGKIPIVLHRIPSGKIKTLTVKQNNVNQRFAIFFCEIESKPIKNLSKSEIGIDVGIENFVTTSDGNSIENPKYLIKSEKRLKRLHRRLSRKKKGSKNRKKAKYLLAKQHLKVNNQRQDFLHKLSLELVKNNSFIAVEDLNIDNMMHNSYLTKYISDASWGYFIKMLEYKAVICDSTLIKVNPRNTSKTCSNCGMIVDIPLSKRIYKCENCGLVLHRDHNAAINILKIGQGMSESNAREYDRRPSLKAIVDEAGTILDKS